MSLSSRVQVEPTRSGLTCFVPDQCSSKSPGAARYREGVDQILKQSDEAESSSSSCTSCFSSCLRDERDRSTASQIAHVLPFNFRSLSAALTFLRSPFLSYDHCLDPSLMDLHGSLSRPAECPSGQYYPQFVLSRQQNSNTFLFTPLEQFTNQTDKIPWKDRSVDKVSTLR